MLRRRHRDDEASKSTGNAGETDTGGEATDVENAGSTSAESDGETPKSERPDGPYDASEVDLAEARSGRVDLGGLLIGAVPGMKLQLQLDQRTGKGTSAVVSIGESAVQVVAVAAPRSSGLWDQTRLQIAADAQRRGGRSEEAAGPFGAEVRVMVPVRAPDGKQVVQPSRISGIDGPRWMLRVTFLGKAITDAGVLRQLVGLVRQIVVIRGSDPMAPGDVIPLTPPADAQQLEPPVGPAAEPPRA